MNVKFTVVLIVMDKVSFGICVYATMEQSYLQLLNWEFLFRKKDSNNWYKYKTIYFAIIFSIAVKLNMQHCGLITKTVNMIRCDVF